jgi:polyisoprenyl-phosphate glycosyltransferase
MESMTKQPTLSVVVPVFNEQEALPRFYPVLSEALERFCPESEIIFVNDGSTDGTARLLTELQASDPRVVIVDLSRNFGHQAALTAGLDVARGEAVLTMDADLEHPPEAIGDFLERWRAGAEIVFGVRRRGQRAGLLKRSTSKGFYWLFTRLASVELKAGAPDFRLMDRRAAAALRSMRERARFLRGMAGWVGFRQATVEFDPGERAGGASGYSLLTMIRFAINGLVSFSKVPIRLTTLMGVVVSLGAFFYAGYALYQHVIAGITVPGWTSMVVVLSLLSGVQLLALGMVGEYIGQVYDEVKQRPIYIVREVVRCRDEEPPLSGGD